MISRYAPQDFIEFLNNVVNLPETVPTFNLEFYVGNFFIFLYKTVAGKTVGTRVGIGENTEGETETMIRWGQDQFTYDQFINHLKINLNAKELFIPLDYKEILLKHNHDMHTHAGIGFDDILL